MSRTYETPKPPRFVLAADAAGERIVIRAPRPPFLLGILLLWLLVWIWAGAWGIVQILRFDQLPVAAPLLVWLLGLLLVVPLLAWLFTGRELIRVVDGDLEIGRQLAGWTRWRRYRGADIAHLRPGAPPIWPGLLQPELSVLGRRRWGAVKFDYGARTIHAAQGMDEAEGRMIVEWLEPRLAGRSPMSEG